MAYPPRGVARSERAYLDHVIASVRPISEYVASLERLYALERAHRDARAAFRSGLASEVLHMPPALEWWAHNLVLLGDAVRRGYPLSLVGYDAVLRDPERVVSGVLRRLGPCNLRAALANVKPELRTQAASARVAGRRAQPTAALRGRRVARGHRAREVARGRAAGRARGGGARAAAAHRG